MKKVQHDIEIEFRDEGLLERALIHSSCLNELLGYKNSNESLAWLGDALINWVVSEHLFNPNIIKMELTDGRKKFVNKEFLAGLSKKHCLDDALIMTLGEEKIGGRRNQKNLHTVFEAIVGAIYMDLGFDVASRFVMKTCVQGELGSQ